MNTTLTPQDHSREKTGIAVLRVIDAFIAEAIKTAKKLADTNHPNSCLAMISTVETLSELKKHIRVILNPPSVTLTSSHPTKRVESVFTPKAI